MQRRNLNSITDQLEITHQTKLGSVLDAIWGSTRVLIRVVRYLLDELRVERRLVPLQAVQEGVEVDMEDVPMDLGTTSSSSEGTGRQSMDSSSRPTTPGDDTITKPVSGVLSIAILGSLTCSPLPSQAGTTRDGKWPSIILSLHHNPQLISQRTLLDIINQSQSPGCKRKRSMTHIGSISIASITPPSIPLSHTKSPSDGAPTKGCLGGGIGKVAERAVVTRRKVGLGRLFSGMGMGMGLSGPVLRDEDADGVISVGPPFVRTPSLAGLGWARLSATPPTSYPKHLGLDSNYMGADAIGRRI